MSKVKRSPLEAIRRFCIECQGDLANAQYVTACRYTVCPFHAYRHGTQPDGQPHRPLSAIKAYCFDNCLPGASREAIADCQGDKAFTGPCPVFPFRLGVNPNISAETREKLRQIALKNNSILLAHGVSRAKTATKTTQATLWGVQP